MRTVSGRDAYSVVPESRSTTSAPPDPIPAIPRASARCVATSPAAPAGAAAGRARRTSIAAAAVASAAIGVRRGIGRSTTVRNPPAAAGLRSVVERVERVRVRPLDRRAADLERRGQLARLLREVVVEDVEALD